MSSPSRNTPRLSVLDGARHARPTVRRVSSNPPPRPSLADTEVEAGPRESTGLWRRPTLPRFHGRYLLERRLGVGGMGTVYRGARIGGGDPVAVKVLSEHLLGSEGAERFRREIAALESLRHPNVVRLLDHGWVGTQPYYVMELVEGPDGTRLVSDEGPQSPARVAAILRHLAAGLAHAHAEGFVHRDIKPSNVILGWDEEVGEVAKLLDFGLVLPDRGVGDRLTAEDMLLGTPGYMAPEGAKSAHAVGPRADLYALAMIGYHLRTGRHLFRPADAVCEEAHAAAMQRGWRELYEVGGLPAPLEHILWRMLSFDARHRPASAQELIDVLDALPLGSVWPRADAERWWAGYRERQAAATSSQLSAR
ncbi:MAG: serine/threonine protein kinase [Sandaracinaceae bacterium]|nr:serine/threonine protein kinase [Sandaracinaceae bacterium]